LPALLASFAPPQEASSGFGPTLAKVDYSEIVLLQAMKDYLSKLAGLEQ